METLANVCQWVGLLLVTLGAFMMFDRWPGHNGIGQVQSGIGWLGLILDWLVNDSRRTEAYRACMERQPSIFDRMPDFPFGEQPPPRPPTFENCSAYLGSPVLTLRDLLGNLLLGLSGAAVGALLAWVVPGHGPEPE